jgi:phosphoglycerate dehydrogenase-like enzyme
MTAHHDPTTSQPAWNQGGQIRLLISETALSDYGDRLRSAGPPIEFLVMHGDASVTDPTGTVVAAAESGLDVAWASSDLFTEGGPGVAFVRYATECSTLSWFHSPAAGTDNPRFRGMIERGVRVTNSHQQSVPIAEYVLRAVLDHLQGASHWRDAQARREWQWRRFREVEGTTWLIVGFGAIGAEVAKRARAFEAYTIGVRRSPAIDNAADEMIHPDQLLEHVPRADVIVLAAPATKETHHLVNADFLARVRQGAVLVNVGRGSLVDEAALLESLERGVPEAAVLDVTEVEPLPNDSSLWSHPRVTITPHNSSLGDRTPGRRADFFVTNLQRFANGEPLLSEVTIDQIGTNPSGAPRVGDRPAALASAPSPRKSTEGVTT